MLSRPTTTRTITARTTTARITTARTITARTTTARARATGPGGTPVVDGAIWVDAAPFRAHLLFVSHTSDVSWPVLAALAGVSHRGARALVVGRGRQPLRRIHPGIASRVLGVDEDRVRLAAGRQVGGEHARLRLLALTSAGWTVAALAERIRMPLATDALAALLREPRAVTCTELTAAVVSALVVLCDAGAPTTAVVAAPVALPAAGPPALELGRAA